jgi:hypothetical protein
MDAAEAGTTVVPQTKSWWVDGLVCAALLAVCFVLVRPTVELPRGDDFSYVKTALEFARTGHLAYNSWGASVGGWQAMAGGECIRLFGFSFTMLRVAMLMVGMAILMLFHQLLLGFGIGRGNALLGTLTMGLSPLYLDVTASFLTDLPGLLPLVLCAWMCQRAVATGTDAGARRWLVAATVVNMGLGTVRQTAWLGALVMVPATIWYLWQRRSRGAALKLIVPLLAVSLAWVLWVLHWCGQQMYFPHEKLLSGGWQHMMTPANLAAQPAKAFATLMLMALPVGLSWLVLWGYRLHGLAAGDRLRSVVWLGGVAVVCLMAAAVLARRGVLDAWIFPWNPFNLINLGAGDLPVWLRVGVSELPVLVVAAWLEQMLRSRGQGGQSRAEQEAFWILGPFSAVYSVLLIPRGLYGVFDRYLLVLLMGAVVFSLLMFERRARQLGRPTGLPLVCLVPLLAFAVYGVGSVHDALAELRATTVALQELHDAGVPRESVAADMGPDGWVQVNAVGHVNFPVPHPAETFHYPPPWTASTACEPQYSYLVPVISPKYILLAQPSACFPPSRFAPVAYRAWLPPFERSVRVDKIR